jgi:hypothetical protein
MTHLRALLVTATIVGPITLSLAAIARDRMFWPFAHYPMYSRLQGPTTEVTRVAGVVLGGPELPLPPEVEPTGLHLHLAIENARRYPDAAARLGRIATAMGAEYERLRAAGEIDGPPLAAVRIYRDTIALESGDRSAVLLSEAAVP